MKKLKAIIVDDEELARFDLRSLLNKYNNINIVGEAADVKSAIELINENNPDVIFLDIQLQRATGFDLLEKVETSAKIIFVTAYDQYAIKAFDINALDYLVKPVDEERLAESIERLGNLTEFSKDEVSAFNYNDAVFLEHDTSYFFVKINTIILVNAAGPYTEVITSKGNKILAHKSMKEWETRLPENSFVRIHRSTIVNIDFIEKIEKWFNYSYKVHVKNIEKPLSISRRYIADIRARMT